MISCLGENGKNARVMKTVMESIERSIAQLDSVGAPADIAAHLDRALCRLREINAK